MGVVGVVNIVLILTLLIIMISITNDASRFTSCSSFLVRVGVTGALLSLLLFGCRCLVLVVLLV